MSEALYWGDEDDDDDERQQDDEEATRAQLSSSNSLPAMLRPCSQSSEKSLKTRPASGDMEYSLGEPVVVMPTQFYAQVEELLAKPPPCLRPFCRSTGETASLPVLRKQRSDLRKGKPTERRRRPQQQQQPVDAARVDAARVREALEYCEKLASTVDPDDEQDAPPNQRQQRRRASARNGSAGGAYATTADDKHSRAASKTRSNSMSRTAPQEGKGRRRRLTDSSSSSSSAAAASSARRPSFNTAAADENNNASSSFRNEEIDSLVQNFETGCGVKELRRQLHESQRSMQASNDFIAEVAQSCRQASM